MPGYGGVYVEVDASAVNSGIAMLSASGEMGTGEGDTQGSWWLHWQWGDTNGFTGHGWFWDNDYNSLPGIWGEHCSNPPQGNGQAYGNTEEEFNRYLSENNIQQLNWLFDLWTTGKGDFAMSILATVGVVQDGGCLQLV